MALDLRHSFEWTASRDPNDETFGDTVTRGDLDDADDRDPAAVLLGEPYDGGVVGRSGARRGPRHLREQLSKTKTHHFDAGPVGHVVDLGDAAVRGRFDGNYRNGTATVQDQIAELAGDVHGLDALPVFLGGDNSLTAANVRPLLDDDVGVVSFDAHLDCREPIRGPSSGTPYRQLFDAGLGQLSVVGARQFETSTEYHDYLRGREGTIVTAEECADPVTAAERAVPDGVDRLYASVDLDVLENAAAPGVSAPTPGGVSTRELYRMLRLVAGDDRLAGVEVVECSPRHDEGDRTARAGARAVAHALAAAGVTASASASDAEP